VVLLHHRNGEHGANSTPFDRNDHEWIAVEVTLRPGKIFYLHGTAGLQDAAERRLRAWAKRFALHVRDVVGIAAELRHQMEMAAVVAKHEAEVGHAKARGIGEKVLKNRLQLAG